MRIRSLSVSLLATSALAALMGCPLDQLSAKPDQAAQAADAGASRSSFENGTGHDDAVDAVADSSWAQPEQRAPGSSALRLLMTDAPLEADSVFVTFCGVYIEPAGAAKAEPSGAARTEPAERAEAGKPEADPSRADNADPERAEADKADAERAEADKAEAERAEAEKAEPAGADAERPEASGRDVPEDRSRAVADAGVPAVDPGADDASRAEWQLISDQCQTLDLLTLQGGLTEAIGIGSLPAGEYGAIRLMLTKASIVLSGLEQQLVVPSGAESGLKIAGGFSLREGGATTITLDFDAGSSIHYAQGRGYVMSPVIHVVDVRSQDDGAPVDGAKGDGDPSEARAGDPRGSAPPPASGAGGRPGSDGEARAPQPPSGKDDAAKRGEAEARPSDPSKSDGAGGSGGEGERGEAGAGEGGGKAAGGAAS